MTTPTPCYGGAIVVEAPAVPQPVKFGLFSVSEFVTGGAPHWQQGVIWEPYACGPATAYACPTCGENVSGTAPVKTYTSGVGEVQIAPFTVYGSFSCSPIGHWEDAEKRALQNLLSGEERAVEAQIADGSLHSSMNLQAPEAVNITPTPGTPVSIPQGIALLESYGALNGNGEFVIMMNRRDALLANATGTLVKPADSGTMLRTILNTPVAALSGFNGRTGPNGVAALAGMSWLFATGKPYIYRTEPFITSERGASLDTSRNDLQILAERTYAVGWDCFTIGVLVESV